MTRILINATHTASTNFNTGIQRVVRRVAQCSQSLQRDLGAECIPIQCFGGRIVAVPRIAGRQSWDERLFATAQAGLRGVVNSIDASIATVSTAASRSVRTTATRCRKALYPRSLVRGAAVGAACLRGREITLREGDIVLMLDSSWESPRLLYDLARQRRCFLAQVVYDLLPVTHSQFFAPDIVASFDRWIEYAIERADCFWAISRTVRDTLYEYYQQRLAAADRAGTRRVAPLSPDQFRSFRLGADLTSLDRQLTPRTAIRKLLSDATPTFLSVGTIEPRKNHLWLLAAFDQHWAQGGGARLVLAGRVGWNSERIVERITTHPYFGSKLYWYQDASDQEVQYMYRHARATAYVSVAEGFGLPIVESLHQGTDVLASDTPIHREVGGENVTYCSLESLDDVVQKINQLACSPKPAQLQYESRVPTWHKSAEQLLCNIVSMADTWRRNASALPGERAA